MRSALEITFEAKREDAEGLIQAEHGEAALESLYSFSDLDCIIDVKLTDGWLRYVLIDGDDEPSTLRRIG